jgi:hypothetical protein
MRLREQIVKANLLVREASYIAEELDKRTEYKVTLQIPTSSLDANRKVRCPSSTQQGYHPRGCTGLYPRDGISGKLFPSVF